MQSELIDQLYENEAVEGVAIFNEFGELTENQLALNELAVVQVCNCIRTLKSGLEGAGRNMKGFVLKTNKYLLQVICQGENLILLQLTPGYSINNTHTKIISQVGKSDSKPVLPGTTQGARNDTATTTESREAQEVPAAADTPLIAWDIFHGSLITLLKRVAPYAVAKKMVAIAALEEGVAEGEDQHIPMQTAFKIGQVVVDKIPNPSRRKMLQKEYDLMIKQY